MEIIDIFVGFYMMKMFFMNICVILLVIVEKCKLNECIIVFYDLIKILWFICKRGYLSFDLVNVVLLMNIVYNLLLFI